MHLAGLFGDLDDLTILTSKFKLMVLCVILMEVINYYADVSGSDDNEEEKKQDVIEKEIFKEDMSDFIDDSDPSDYYSLTNLTRTLSSVEEDSHSQYNMHIYLDNNVEARNYWPSNYNVEEKKVDEF